MLHSLLLRQSLQVDDCAREEELSLEFIKAPVTGSCQSVTGLALPDGVLDS